MARQAAKKATTASAMAIDVRARVVVNTTLRSKDWLP